MVTNSEPAAQSETRRTRRGAFTGQKIGGNRITAVQGLLNSGVSKSKIAKDLKISRNSVIAIEHRMRAEGLQNPTHVQAIESVFRDKSKVVADLAISSISAKKLTKASALECVKVAREAGIMGGLVTVSPAPAGNQLNVLQQFFGLQSGLRSISAVDALPTEQKQEHDASEA